MAEHANRYGLLGRTIPHSFSPRIYPLLGLESYELFEREPEELLQFLHEQNWSGINVTIPYKQAVMPYLDEIDPLAARLGNVNTIVRTPERRLHGYNTDYHGFYALCMELPHSLDKKPCLILGTGGAAKTAACVLEDRGHTVYFASRNPRAGSSSHLSYDELASSSIPFALLVNATPVGTYPHCPKAPLTLDALPHLETVIDLIYNPSRTALLMDAERRGIAALNGLRMLVVQAAKAYELYTGKTVSSGCIDRIIQQLDFETKNIVLIGMPGSGKTTVGKELARLLGRTHIDMDDAYTKAYKLSPQDAIKQLGEQVFRTQESQLLQQIAARSEQVISCGGGVVELDINYQYLHQHSTIVMLDRPLEELETCNRPLSARYGVEALAQKRMHRYRMWSDVCISSQESVVATAKAINDALIHTHNTCSHTKE
ncbi:AAA family ATPase [Collinsella sp. zg1085]|uniref:shikimate kinase n=1 Tax=Collinsella sp. zg1085 TaxID=2844380 RepID=UPI001C0B8B07|nr:shikimate kinase [Collinsella sp. zg1085]QWT17073.1 AAA family ATPase [Collinsella sp. zg1085]